MKKLKDDPRSRLERLAEAVRNRAPLDAFLEAFGQSDLSQKRADWENMALYDAQMQVLSALDPDFDARTEGPLRMAFEKFGLSPENPHHWRSLLTYFAFVHFGSPTLSRGHPKKWNGNRLCQLLHDVATMRVAAMRKSEPRLSNTAIFAAMTKDKVLKSRYGEETTDSLKDAYRNARDPRINATLGLIRDNAQLVLWTTYRETIKTTGISFEDDDVRSLIPSLALERAIELVETRWPDARSAISR